MRQPVDARRVLERYHVQPADAARPPRGRAVLGTDLAQLVRQLWGGRQRSRLVSRELSGNAVLGANLVGMP